MEEKEKKLQKVKRIFAIIGVFILLGFYVVTLIAAFGAGPDFNRWFIASLAATGFVPTAIYIFIRLYKTFG